MSETWNELKSKGSEHYRGSSQPIDIYRSKGTFKAFALCSIVKYAVRNMDKDLNPKDMDKIIHYSQLLLANDAEGASAALRKQQAEIQHDRILPDVGFDQDLMRKVFAGVKNG